MPRRLGFNRGMTSREKDIVEFIRQKITDSGYPPTVREICDSVGLRSTSTVHSYLGRLERLGVIKRDPASSRAIEVTEDIVWRRKKIIGTPVVGTVRAGEPVLAEENIDTVLPLPAELIGDQPSFMMTVHGDSMIKAGLADGDLVVAAQQETAEDGDIVVASVGNAEPAVMLYAPSDDVKIFGKVVALFRHM